MPPEEHDGMYTVGRRPFPDLGRRRPPGEPMPRPRSTVGRHGLPRLAAGPSPDEVTGTGFDPSCPRRRCRGGAAQAVRREERRRVFWAVGITIRCVPRLIAERRIPFRRVGNATDVAREWHDDPARAGDDVRPGLRAGL